MTVQFTQKLPFKVQKELTILWAINGNSSDYKQGPAEIIPYSSHIKGKPGLPAHTAAGDGVIMAFSHPVLVY